MKTRDVELEGIAAGVWVPGPETDSDREADSKNSTDREVNGPRGARGFGLTTRVFGLTTRGFDLTTRKAVHVGPHWQAWGPSGILRVSGPVLTDRQDGNMDRVTDGRMNNGRTDGQTDGRRNRTES